MRGPIQGRVRIAPGVSSSVIELSIRLPFVCGTHEARIAESRGILAAGRVSRLSLLAIIDLEVDEIPRADSFCAHTILRSDVLIVPDPTSDQRFVSSFLVQQIGIRFYAGIPLITVESYP